MSTTVDLCYNQAVPSHSKFQPFTATLLCILASIGGTSAWARTQSLEDRLFSEAMDYAKQKQYSKSSERLARLVKMKPKKALYWFNLGNAHYLRNGFKKAIECYERVALLKSPLEIPARLYEAKSLREIGNLKSAQEKIDTLRAISLPPNLNAEVLAEQRKIAAATLISSGYEKYAQGDYRQAAKDFKLALQFDPSTDTSLMLGLSYLKLGYPQTAQSVLSEASVSQTDPVQRKSLEDLVFQIKEGIWKVERNWNLELEFSIGYNSNPSLDDELQDNSASTQMGIQIGASYLLHKSSSHQLKLATAAGIEGYTELSDDTFYRFSFVVPFYYFPQSWIFELSPGFERQYLAGTPYVDRATLGGGALYRLGAWSTGIRGTLSRNFASEGDYLYLRGAIQGLRLFVQWQMADWFIRSALNYKYENTGDLVDETSLVPGAYSGYSLEFDVHKQVSEILILNVRWVESFKYFFARYLPGDLVRRDNQTHLQLEARLRLNPEWETYANVMATINRSTLGANTLDNKNYSQWALSGGFRWQLGL